MPEYHKRGSRNTTHMLFQNPKKSPYLCSVNQNKQSDANHDWITGRQIYINE